MRRLIAVIVTSVALAACGDNTLPTNAPPSIEDASLTTTEDTPASVTLEAVDPDEDPLEVTVSGPSRGTLTRDGLTLTYTPDPDFHGDDEIVVTVSDGEASAQATVAIVVTPVNDPPVGAPDAFAATADTPLDLATSAVLANDTDVDGDALSVTAVGDADGGTVALADDTITFTPAGGFTGDASFAYTLSDGVASVDVEVTVTVGGANEAPIAVDDAATTAEDTAAVIAATTLLANDTDANGQTLTITAVAGATGGAVALAGTTITFTPAADFAGTAGFDYTVSDGALTDTGHVTVTVTPVNDGPVATDDAATTAEDAAATIAAADLLANDTDLDGPSLAVTAVSGATGGAVALAGTTITFTPAADFTGAAGFDYTVSDGALTDTGHVTVTVTPVNDGPVATDDAATTAEDSAAAILAATLLANDLDVDGPSLAVTAVSDATGGAVALDGTTITFTPTADFTGEAGFDYTVSDGTLTDVGHVTLTVTPVNDAPVATDDAATTAEDTAATIAASDLLANDADLDGPSLALTAVSGATGGAVALAGDTITFTPAPDFVGTAGFDYTIFDGTLTDVGHVTVTVTPVNDAPVAVDDGATTTEEQAATIAASDLLANDTDVDGPALTLTAVSGATGGAVLLTAGTITFVPAEDFTGNAGFDYTVSDGTLTDVGHVTVTVTPVNDGPVAIDDAGTIPEDTAAVFDAATLVANDLDPDTATLTITAVSAASGGTVVLDGATITFTPAPDLTGEAGFDYTVSDGALSDIGHVTVTVTPVNDAPVATDDSAATGEESPVAIAATTLLANDADIDGDTLTVVAVSGAVNGTVSLAGATITFTPAVNFTGAARFDYTVSDGALTDVGRVTVNVNSDNDPPIAIDDTVTTEEDVPVAIPTATLLANDADPDLDVLSIAGVQNPVHGAVALAAGTITFTPDTDFIGEASFEYVVTDGQLTDVAVVTVEVGAIDDVPVAVDDAATTDEDDPVGTVVLANDTGLGDGVTVVVINGPANGSTVVNLDQTITYLPAPEFSGVDSYVYELTDGDGDTATATVTITVENVNDPAVVADVSASTTEDVAVVVTLTATDVDSTAVTFAVAADPGHGTLGPVTATGPLSATVTYTPGLNYAGADQFTVTANDGGVTSLPGTVSVTITNVIECSDGVVESPETCDDQGAADGDGCSASCATETGWSCVGAPSACEPICGDGQVVGGEGCDDQNGDDTDGCTAQCAAGPVCTSAAIAGGDAFAVDPATGTCYVAFDGEATTFDAAYAACLALDGHMVTITDQAEQDLVAALPAGIAWIGASDVGADDDDVFDWVTDEAWGYDAFAAGQPDDDVGVDGQGECLAMDAAGEWLDTNCNFAGFVAGRICELPGDPCGDGLVQPSETCDDGGQVDGDGCSSSCQLEPGRLLLTEVDYDQPGSDSTEFIEITNVGGLPVDLTAYSLVLINGASSGNDVEYFSFGRSARILLSEARDASNVNVTTLAPGQRLVIASNTVTIDAGALRIRGGASDLIQNGQGSFGATAGDALGILDIAATQLVDALSYEGNVTTGTIAAGQTRDFTEGSGAGLNLFGAAGPNETSDFTGSLVRVYDGGVPRDTNDPNADWVGTATPTPGT